MEHGRAGTKITDASHVGKKFSARSNTWTLTFFQPVHLKSQHWFWLDWVTLGADHKTALVRPHNAQRPINQSINQSINQFKYNRNYFPVRSQNCKIIPIIIKLSFFLVIVFDFHRSSLFSQPKKSLRQKMDAAALFGDTWICGRTCCKTFSSAAISSPAIVSSGKCVLYKIGHTIPRFIGMPFKWRNGDQSLVSYLLKVVRSLHFRLMVVRVIDWLIDWLICILVMFEFSMENQAINWTTVGKITKHDSTELRP